MKKAIALGTLLFFMPILGMENRSYNIRDLPKELRHSIASDIIKNHPIIPYILERMAIPRTELLPKLSDSAITTIAFSPDGNYCAIGSYSGTVKLWHIPSLKTSPQPIIPFEPSPLSASKLNALFFTSDNKYLICIFNCGEMRHYDLINKKIEVDWGGLPRKLQGPREFKCFAYNNHEIICTGHYAGTVNFWDISGQHLHVFLSQETAITAGAWAPDGKHLAIGSFNGTITIRDCSAIKSDDPVLGSDTPANDYKDPKLITSFSSRHGAVHALAFSPNGKYLAWQASNDHFYSDDEPYFNTVITIMNFPACTTKKIITLSIPSYLPPNASLSFSPDSTFLAMGAWDGTVRIINVISRNHKKLSSGLDKSPSGLNSTTQVAFSPAGNVLVSGAQNGAITFWHWKRYYQIKKYLEEKLFPYQARLLTHIYEIRMKKKKYCLSCDTLSTFDSLDKHVKGALKNDVYMPLTVQAYYYYKTLTQKISSQRLLNDASA